MSQPRNSTDPLLPVPVTNDQLKEEDDKMGISASTARVLAPLSFVIDFAAQTYGMSATPNMKQIHDSNPCAFSPYPFAIAGFFGPQQILQLVWLRELFRPDNQVELGTRRFVPWYALGNFCIAGWMFLWKDNNLKGSSIPVIINTLTQTYYVFFLRDKTPNTYQAKLTNIINITFAGIGILDIFHNVTAAFFPRIPPTLLVKIATSIGGPLTALASPLLFGACMAYDLMGLAIGQHELASKALNGLGGGGGEGWARLLGGVGMATAAIVGLRGYGGAKWL
ncbi:hypothetical protein M231_00323 [Tremella mesenterica]|uniref:Uncharacterized protein n=1 Tax=Tremella mesenterica TaxID=5217 RepID=A0A4Q1BW01_TREME|nr:hypothetical protein M231_00323 [Tremella mesenterica]